eukprot:6374625-Prymnesium_polylepis.1
MAACRVLMRQRECRQAGRRLPKMSRHFVAGYYVGTYVRRASRGAPPRFPASASPPILAGGYSKPTVFTIGAILVLRSTCREGGRETRRPFIYLFFEC